MAASTVGCASPLAEHRCAYPRGLRRLHASRAADPQPWSLPGCLRMHQLDEPPQLIARCRRQHAVPQVEDVPGTPTRAEQNTPGFGSDGLERPEQRGGLEVALDTE